MARLSQKSDFVFLGCTFQCPSCVVAHSLLDFHRVAVVHCFPLTSRRTALPWQSNGAPRRRVWWKSWWRQHLECCCRSPALYHQFYLARQQYGSITTPTKQATTELSRVDTSNHQTSNREMLAMDLGFMPPSSIPPHHLTRFFTTTTTWMVASMAEAKTKWTGQTTSLL